MQFLVIFIINTVDIGLAYSDRQETYADSHGQI